MKSKQDIKLYNVFFPLWMILLFPHVWILVFPVNFLVDSLVLIISMAVLKMVERKKFFWSHIWKVFAFGMLADFVGAGYMYLMTAVLELAFLGDEWYITLPALIISAGLIFVFNYFITFRKDEKAIRLKFALIYTIATAPYTFLVPLSWLYG